MYLLFQFSFPSPLVSLCSNLYSPLFLTLCLPTLPILFPLFSCLTLLVYCQLFLTHSLPHSSNSLSPPLSSTLLLCSKFFLIHCLPTLCMLFPLLSCLTQLLYSQLLLNSTQSTSSFNSLSPPFLSHSALILSIVPYTLSTPSFNSLSLPLF